MTETDDDELAKLRQEHDRLSKERDRLSAELQRIDRLIKSRECGGDYWPHWRQRPEIEMLPTHNGAFVLDHGKLSADELYAALKSELDESGPRPGFGFDRTYTSSYHGTYRGHRVAVRDINQWHNRYGESKKAPKWIAYFPDLNKKWHKTFKSRKDAVAWLVQYVDTRMTKALTSLEPDLEDVSAKR